MATLIQGNRIGIRDIDGGDDEIVFRSLSDWDDVNGRWTRHRAILRVGNAVMENDSVHYPLAADSDFYHNMILTHTDPDSGVVTDIGYTYDRCWGKRCWVNAIAFHPDWRGRGLFDETYRVYSYLIFELYQADMVWHDDFLDVHALRRMREINTGEELGNARGRDRFMTERQSVKWRFTKEMYENHPAPYVLNTGEPLALTVNHEAIAAQNDRALRRYLMDRKRAREERKLDPGLQFNKRVPLSLRELAEQQGVA